MAKKFLSFVFTETTKKQIDSMPDDMKLKFYNDVTNYGIYGKEPEDLSDVEMIIWISMKDLIDNCKNSRGGAPEGNSNATKVVAEMNPEKTVPPKARKPLKNREPVNDLESIEKIYLDNYSKLFEKGVLKVGNPVVNWGQARKLCRDAIDKYGLQKIDEAVRKSVDSEFCVSKGYSLITILSSGVLATLINGNQFKKRNAVEEKDHPEDVGEILF